MFLQPEKYRGLPLTGDEYLSNIVVQNFKPFWDGKHQKYIIKMSQTPTSDTAVKDAT